MRKNVFLGSIILTFVITICILNIVKYFEVQNVKNDFYDSMIGLSINGSATTIFPSKESGLVIDSINCDKGAIGVWDYSNWMLRLKNLSQNRAKCQINFVSKYTENILNGADPVLKDGLIPVEISDNGTVTRARLKDSWYSYENQKWANAVILISESREYYEGEEISEDDIESYFVWIPRYQYKIWNLGLYEGLTSIDYNQVHTIEVIFGTDTTTDTDTSCASPGISGESGTCSVGKYMTHPAFTSFDVNGIWVGKFETGYKGATSTSAAEVNANDSSKIQIKPNVYSWRGIQVANAYLSSYDYKREYDSHMMKNTEWGAVAYLQHSKYGNRASVRINNNSSYFTGYAAVHEPTTGYTGTNISCTTTPDSCNEYGTGESVTKPWNTEVGYLASITGNISGIYDMSGGAWEYVMGVMTTQAGVPCAGREETYTSGFEGPYCYLSGTASGKKWPDKKYYDTYTYSTVDEEYHRRILGDATGEMGPFSSVAYSSSIGARKLGSWYNDEAWFVWSGFPWFERGGHYAQGFGADVFVFIYNLGSVHTSGSFRVVLSV